MSRYVDVPAFKLCALCLGVMGDDGTCGCEPRAFDQATPKANVVPMVRPALRAAFNERQALQEELARHKATLARLQFTPSAMLAERSKEIAARLEELDQVICGRRAS